MPGIVSYGAYLPYFRLDRKLIAQALGQGGGRGSRAVASYDEDTTSMGVEAARHALGAISSKSMPSLQSLLFCTSAPAYLDKTNATAVHAALGLDSSVGAFDFGGAPRSAIGAVLLATGGSRNTLVVASDTRTGKPGGADEANGGDGAVALVTGSDQVLVELVAQATATAEFLDRWRTPGDSNSQLWEERFGENEYVPLAAAAVADALKQAGLSVEEIDHLVVAGVHTRAVGVIAKGVGIRAGALADDLTSSVGSAGTAASWLVFCDVLDRAGANETIVQVNVADGVDVLVWQTTSKLSGFREARTTPSVQAQITGGNTSLSYPQFLTWKGELVREPARRPDPDRLSATASGRNVAWKFGFNASRCLACETRHLPPMRVCLNCNSVDNMMGEPLADIQATIATYTIDRLAFTLSPPVVAVVIDYDGGGRFTCEMTDVDPVDVAIGQRVAMTFRRLNTAQGIHNYFWKARPLRD
jgi:hydroxymethylglutaryl-CoA synthase